MIIGVNKVTLQRIPDERGTIFHMLRADDPHFLGFGEIYFSTVYEGVVKGWHRHRLMTLNYAVPFGRIKLVLYDDRADSATRGTIEEHFLGPDDYSLVQVPPGVWNGFKGMTDLAMVANCCTHTHDPGRSERLDPFSGGIPYDWAVRHHLQRLADSGPQTPSIVTKKSLLVGTSRCQRFDWPIISQACRSVAVDPCDS